MQSQGMDSAQSVVQTNAGTELHGSTKTSRTSSSSCVMTADQSARVDNVAQVEQLLTTIGIIIELTPTMKLLLFVITF
eukprot:m.142319 g.142319  ORF g.142319 m.142319 type:complete len:78 (+) comp14052_c1_seq8:2496-2729(+)